MKEKMWAVIEDGRIAEVFKRRRTALMLRDIFFTDAKIKRCEVKVLCQMQKKK